MKKLTHTLEPIGEVTITDAMTIQDIQALAFRRGQSLEKSIAWAVASEHQRMNREDYVTSCIINGVLHITPESE